MPGFDIYIENTVDARGKLDFNANWVAFKCVQNDEFHLAHIFSLLGTFPIKFLPFFLFARQ
jgi:hypothetical protein